MHDAGALRAHHFAQLCLAATSPQDDVLPGVALCTCCASESACTQDCAPCCIAQGPTMDPRTASELSLRLPHLGLRVAEHSRRALAVAERLQQVEAPCSSHVATWQSCLADA